VPPLFALLDRSYQQANYMLDLNWAPLNAATVISMPAWQRIPEHYRPELLAVTRRAGRSLREAIRQAGDEAVVEMQARGLQVMELDAPTRDLWHREVEGAWPRLRGTFVEPSLYDEVMRLREEYRNGRKE
jgi:TRAP-type C4-dicarboxylate transport system substrate-binding protein